MQRTIDLNCDMGESFGIYKMGLDNKVIELISSANIACGFHAGDPNTINNTVELAKKFNVKVGAHPSFWDLNGFGRRYMEIEKEDLINLIVYQLGAIQSFCKKHNLDFHHIKLHGALGNIADVDNTIANYVIEAILHSFPDLIIYTKENSEIKKVAEQNQLNFITELYADRAYNDDLTLVSRKQYNSVIHDPDVISERIEKMLTKGVVTSYQGNEINIKGESICVHSDTPESLEIIKSIREVLNKIDYQVRPPF